MKILMIVATRVAAERAGFANTSNVWPVHRHDGSMTAWWPERGVDLLRGRGEYWDMVVVDSGTRFLAEVQGQDWSYIKGWLQANLRPQVWVSP